MNRSNLKIILNDTLSYTEIIFFLVCDGIVLRYLHTNTRILSLGRTEPTTSSSALSSASLAGVFFRT